MAETPTEAIATVTEKEESLSLTPSTVEETKPENEQPVISETAQIQGLEAEKPKPVDPRKVPISTESFKEESSKVADLLDSQRKALDELKLLVKEALDKHEFTDPAPPPLPAALKAEEVKTVEGETAPPNPSAEVPVATVESTSDVPIPTEPAKAEAETLDKAAESPSEVSIWGIPLLKDDRTDVILLKFLRARDFKVKDALTMLKNTIRWRKEFNIDALLDEDLGDDLDKVVFMQGFDKEGHSVCYNVYGEFQNKELYKKTFSDEEKRTNFLRWRIQFLERTIRKLDFSPGGISTFFQITDLKNSPGPAHKELRIATKQALQLLQDNYPEFVAKQVFINVPWWYLAFYTMISPFLTQRTKSKFVFASLSKTADTLYKYISPEQVPIQYGGLSVDLCDCNPDFGIDDQATEITVKPSTKQSVEIQVLEKCVIIWELRVVGWEVSYSAEFIPNIEGAYTMVIQKGKKMAPTDDPVVTSSFKVTELGKIVLSVDNPTSKKKKLVYRFTVKPLAD